MILLEPKAKREKIDQTCKDMATAASWFTVCIFFLSSQTTRAWTASHRKVKIGYATGVLDGLPCIDYPLEQGPSTYNPDFSKAILENLWAGIC